MKKARIFLIPLLIISFLFPMAMPVAQAESSSREEAAIVSGMTDLIREIISYMSSTQFLAYVAGAIPQTASLSTTQQVAPTEPVTPPQPAPDKKNDKLKKFCTQKGGQYLEIPGQTAKCIIKHTPSGNDKFYVEVCEDTQDPILGIQCADLKIICPAGQPVEKCYVEIDYPGGIFGPDTVRCDLVIPSQYPGKVQLKCTGIPPTSPVNICYSYDPVKKEFLVESCPATPPISIPGFPFSVPLLPGFEPWIPGLPAPFIPPGYTPPTSPTTPATPASSAQSLQSLVNQLNALMVQLSSFGKINR